MSRGWAWLLVALALSAAARVLLGHEPESPDLDTEGRGPTTRTGDARSGEAPRRTSDLTSDPPAGLRGPHRELASGTVSGIVVDDATRRPLAGVQVIAVTNGWPASRFRRTTTDGKGRYSLTLDLGSWLLTTWHPSYVPAGRDDVVLELR